MTRRNKQMPPEHPVSARKSTKGDDNTRSAPDPFTVVLPALAALGAISSIASINWAAEEKSQDRPRAKRKAASALRDLENCCLGLAEIFRRFRRYPELFCGEGGTKSSPLKFGVHGPRIPHETSRAFFQLINDVASMLVLASQNAFDVMSAVEDGEIDPPEAVFYGFGECQDRLNKLIQDRATMKQSVETGYELTQVLLTLVNDMKKSVT